MHTKYLIIGWSLLLCTNFLYGQKKFKVIAEVGGSQTVVYSLVDEKGQLIKQLDTARYYLSIDNDGYGFFAIFGIRDEPGWSAIDADGNILFKVYNTSYGEPSPDYLIEGRIRIVDTNNKIGFANEKGVIVIQPQFEAATSSHNGKAIVGKQCEQVPWDKHAKEADCHHYSLVCRQHGYIDDKGAIHQMSAASFEQVAAAIDWKQPDE